ncbi:MAG: aspartate dehydrogenase [Aristaeellaceae bacterium]
MRLFHRKQPTLAYDPARQIPALRCSICTGEQVAGFRDRATGKFEDIALIRTPGDLEDFCRACGVEPAALEKIY